MLSRLILHIYRPSCQDRTMRGESVAAGPGDLFIHRIMPVNTDRDEQFLDELTTLKRQALEKEFVFSRVGD